MPDSNLADLLATAETVARVCGQFVHSRQTEPFTVADKGFRDVVTEVDWDSQQLATRLIRQRFPDHGFLAEETDHRLPTTGPVIWAIDPLDGTVNFSRQLPAFAISVAAIVDGAPGVGVIYDPLRDEMFSAVRGAGCSLNGRPICASPLRNLNQALLALGWGRSDADRRRSMAVINRLTYRVMSLRAFGSYALCLAWIAAGRLDAFFTYQPGPWDVAAGLLLVQEAGGLTSSLTGEKWDWSRPDTWRLTSNGHLHSQLLAALPAVAEMEN